MPVQEHDRAFPEGKLTAVIIGAFYRVYDTLGSGFLESVYRNSLAYEARLRGLSVLAEAPIEVWYSGVRVGHFRADLLVERRVVVEIKAADRLTSADHKQLLNYLRCSRLEVGLLLHFGPKPCFRRIVHSSDRKQFESIRVKSELADER